MIITCSNFFTVRAEDGEETNYSEPVLVETVNEETTSDSLEEVEKIIATTESKTS